MMIDGITYSKNENCKTFIVAKLSDELKSCIKSYFLNVCLGPNDNSIISNYNNMIKEFISRYKSKSEDEKMGYISEFLIHILIRCYDDNFAVLSPFFNSEDRSARKGFDVVIFNKYSNELIIDETKSGKNNINDPSKSCINLLSRAKYDLIKRINSNDENNKYIWYKAITESEKAYQRYGELGALENEIQSYNQLMNSEEGISTKEVNVLLAAVLFENTRNIFDTDLICQEAIKYSNKKIFKSVYVIVAQENTYTEIIDFIENEANE